MYNKFLRVVFGQFPVSISHHSLPAARRGQAERFQTVPRTQHREGKVACFLPQDQEGTLVFLLTSPSVCLRLIVQLFFYYIYINTCSVIKSSRVMSATLMTAYVLLNVCALYLKRPFVPYLPHRRVNSTCLG